MDITGDYDSGRLGHAQRIMGNGVIILPLHKFKHPSQWYYKAQGNKMNDF
jgi:hypothetical protein